MPCSDLSLTVTGAGDYFHAEELYVFIAKFEFLNVTRSEMP
jgi:hypothetical protein